MTTPYNRVAGNSIERLALLLYWANVLLLGAVLFAGWGNAVRNGQLQEHLNAAEIGDGRRIVIAQSLYAFGAALCMISPYWSIGFIMLVQLNYAIAPRIWLLWRL